MNKKMEQHVSVEENTPQLEQQKTVNEPEQVNSLSDASDTGLVSGGLKKPTFEEPIYTTLAIGENGGVPSDPLF